MRLLRYAAVPVAVCLLQSDARAQAVTLTFEQALALARAQAPAVRVARARIDEARGRLIGARVRFRENPTIDAAVGPRSTEAGTFRDLDIGFTQSFETGGQRAARIAGAEASILREAETADEAVRLALRDVALAFLRTLHAQERVTLLRGVEDVSVDVVDVANRRYAAGDIAVLDVNVAKSVLARGRAARLAADAERRIAAGSLDQLLGGSGNRALAVQGSLRLDRRPDLDRLIAAVDTRPDLRALRSDIADAEADIRLGLASTRPDVGIGARVKREEGNRAVLGEVMVTWPVFNRGQELQSTGAARAARLRIELDTRRTAAISEIQTLFDASVMRQAAVAAFEQDALPSLDENETLARRSFDVGQISLPDWLLIRRELVDTRLDYLDRLLEFAEALIAQDAAAGVLQ